MWRPTPHNLASSTVYPRSDPQAIADTKYYRRDIQAEQAFREVSSSITTRGNVFRVFTSARR